MLAPGSDLDTRLAWLQSHPFFYGQMAMTEAEAQRQKEIQQAEELLFSRPAGAWFRQGTVPRTISWPIG